MLWIKEVEMVDSLDELKSPRSVCGKDFPNFKMLDTKIASALSKIIQNSLLKKKVSFEEQKASKEDRLQRGRQIASMIYDYFRVTGAHDTVLDCGDLISVTLHEADTRAQQLSHSQRLVPPRVTSPTTTRGQTQPPTTEALITHQHSYTAHIKHVVVLRFQKTCIFPLFCAPSTSTNWWFQEIYWWQTVKPTPIPLGGHLSRSMVSTSLPTDTSDLFQDTVEITNQTTLQVESASGRQLNAHALSGWGDYENILQNGISGFLRIRNRISEDVARSELEAMERDARYALFCQDQWFKIALWDYQRQARDAVNHAVRESSGNYEVTMICQKFKVFNIDTKGEWKKMKEERHKWLDPKHETLQVVKRSTCCMNIRFFFKHETEKKGREKSHTTL